MTYRTWHILAALTLGVSTAAAQTPAPALPTPEPVWVYGDISAPESTYLDLESNAIYVSVINGGVGDKDGNGFIAKLGRDGKPIAAQWATGLNGPKGSRAAGRTLWVADIDELVGIDLNSGQIKTKVKVADAKFLNDVATAPDGTIYTSDSTLNRIYMVKDGVASVFAEGEAVEAPNGLLVDGSRLLVGTMRQVAADQKSGPGRVIALDLKTKEKTVFSGDIGAIDGVESDGKGGFIVSAVRDGKIVHVSPKGVVTPLKQLKPNAADIAYDVQRKVVIVPHLNQNRVAAYDLSDVLK